MNFNWLSARRRERIRPWIEVIATAVLFAACGLAAYLSSAEAIPAAMTITAAVVFPLCLWAVVEI
jgi:hypothetical protein